MCSGSSPPQGSLDRVDQLVKGFPCPISRTPGDLSIYVSQLHNFLRPNIRLHNTSSKHYSHTPTPLRFNLFRFSVVHANIQVAQLQFRQIYLVDICLFTAIQVSAQTHTALIHHSLETLVNTRSPLEWYEFKFHHTLNATLSIVSFRFLHFAVCPPAPNVFHTAVATATGTSRNNKYYYGAEKSKRASTQNTTVRLDSSNGFAVCGTLKAFRALYCSASARPS